jgi:hypothetical protein
MTNGPTGIESPVKGRKLYSVNVHAKVQSSPSCSFCWFILSLYPTLKAMTPRDEATYKTHLEKEHGLQKEIQA